MTPIKPSAPDPDPDCADLTMDTDALDEMLDADLAQGDIPFCVVGQAGSINVGAIDPLDKISAICRARKLWFHVDGACGAVGAMLPELRERYVGLDQADSVTLDPHKWLYVQYECGCVLIRNPEHQRRAFTMDASYLRNTGSQAHAGHDFFENGPQMSRGFRAFKLWMSIKHYGANGYRALLRQNRACVAHLDRLVRADPDFEALHEPVINIYSFRLRPARYAEDVEADPDAHGEWLDQLNQHICDAVVASGLAFFLTSRIKGRTVLRLSVCSHRTTLADIEQVFHAMRTLGQKFDADGR